MSNPETAKFRRHSGAPGLYGLARARFERIDDKVRNRGASLADHPAAALEMFAFKNPTMLGFDGDATHARNPENLFGIARAPCDTAVRERLDEVDPRELRPVFREVFSQFQRGGGLKGMESVAGHYLVSFDGTEFSGSGSAECGSCRSRTHRGGNTTYFHRTVCASLVRPGSGTVIPFMPEMIPETDGSAKNACEANAAERLLPDLRREHSHPEFAVPGMACTARHRGRACCGSRGSPSSSARSRTTARSCKRSSRSTARSTSSGTRTAPSTGSAGQRGGAGQQQPRRPSRRPGILGARS